MMPLSTSWQGGARVVRSPFDVLRANGHNVEQKNPFGPSLSKHEQSRF